MYIFIYLFIYYLYDSALVFVACVICYCIIWFLDVFKVIVINVFSLRKEEKEEEEVTNNTLNSSTKVINER